ncbi:maltokinase N-terminal cap-like domain-containing protein [Actinomadura flavalba]|uniref:maltokinase N-terminal cap-like domain-containing protein n=1 Tax=Actinomadura flavalba TaxID=1120938 RepID=UPI0003A9BBC9|nr:hypothetical protein [Actinomadura flavalba]
MASAEELLLIHWLPRQRWFAGKDRPVTAVRVSGSAELFPGLRFVVLDVEQGSATDRYQLYLGVGEAAPGGLIGPVGPGTVVYDAVHDPALASVLLDRIDAETSAGALRFRRAPGVALDTAAGGRPLGAEQSNTSLVYGTSHILKLFRRLSPGRSPDLEINLALTSRASPYAPAVHGWIELDEGDEPVTLALLSAYVPGAADGWELATARAASAESFAAEAAALGEATAAVHRDLAELFDVRETTSADLAALVDAMRAQLDETSRTVAELRPHAEAIGAVFDTVRALDDPPPLQRVHGDYHLGQALYTGDRWVLLDFEGEPARSPAERRAPSPALRDVAGMLRSFDYAAHASDADASREPSPGASSWAEETRAAFLRGYSSAGGAAVHPDLLHALELDKAVYEIRYEAAHRPAWLPIPLNALSRLTTTRQN